MEAQAKKIKEKAKRMALLARYVGKGAGNIQTRPSNRMFKRAYSTLITDELGISTPANMNPNRREKSSHELNL